MESNVQQAAEQFLSQVKGRCVTVLGHTRFRLLGVWWDVYFHDFNNSDDAMGTTFFAHHQISVAVTPSWYSTYVHEYCHAVIWMSGHHHGKHALDNEQLTCIATLCAEFVRPAEWFIKEMPFLPALDGVAYNELDSLNKLRMLSESWQSPAEDSLTARIQ